jgi:bifunctional DNA-binding transcriptional regulator/antitoxin component of YhaV-PrlF toxin-antitoxin module
VVLAGKVLMGSRKKVDHLALVRAVEKGVPKKKLMEQFGYNSVNGLKIGYLNALIKMGRAEGFISDRKKTAPNNIVTVNSRGNLVIPKALVDQYQLNSGQILRVNQSGNDLLLLKEMAGREVILRKKKDKLDRQS